MTRNLGNVIPTLLSFPPSLLSFYTSILPSVLSSNDQSSRQASTCSSVAAEQGTVGNQCLMLDAVFFCPVNSQKKKKQLIIKIVAESSVNTSKRINKSFNGDKILEGGSQLRMKLLIHEKRLNLHSDLLFSVEAAVTELTS